jgi:hypothetical protein
MDWAFSSLDQIWRSASFPMWVTLAAAGFFAILMLITLVRAERSVANGALTVITLLAVSVAVAATTRGLGLAGSPTSATSQAAPPAMAAAPALACIDDLAGETVLTACEKTLFGSPESAAAAISYAATQITRLTSLGDVATVNRNLTPEVESLRRSIERDRYGLMAYVLVARDHCSPQACAAFRSLGNSRQIMTNMDDRVYEGLVMRYSASWGAPAAAPAIAAMPSGALAALPPPAGMPTGKPTTMIDFPSASSTPPVSIMTPEPGAPGSAAPRAAAPARPAAAAAAPNAPAAPAAPPAAAKKQAPPKSARAPTPLAPPPGSQPPSSPPPAPASAADND